MAFDKKIKLFKRIQAKGAGYPSQTEPITVWADVMPVGVTTQYSAAAAGKRCEIAARLWKSDYRGETHAIIDNATYQITGTGATENRLIIKLMLAKGD